MVFVQFHVLASKTLGLCRYIIVKNHGYVIEGKVKCAVIDALYVSEERKRHS